MTPPRINTDRLWESLEIHGRIGATADGGVNREALSDADRAGRDLFVRWCEEAGLSVGIDNLGTIYATRPGEHDVEPVAMGSHLDTQPTGGKYDGILGVLGGLEVVRALDDAGTVTRRPLTIVNWTNEEGSRFVPSMVASGIYAGVFPPALIEDVRDSNGVAFTDALKAIGYQGREITGARRFAAFVELHIEQGPVLETSGVEIGVVTGCQAMDWSRVTIVGTAAHAGTTPMEVRLDPLAAAVRLIDDLYANANALPDARATIGVFEALPGSHSTIPHTVRFTLDLRHPDAGILAQQIHRFEARMAREEERGYRVIREVFGTAEAERFDPAVTSVIREAARDAGYGFCDITSGAGHDAVYINRVCPTGMIFVPCENGISHNPRERITPEHASAGVDVLLRTILNLANN